MSDQITIVGTVVNDPERRRTSGGVTVANLRVASNVRRRDEATGSWVDGHTNWYSVSAYRGLAEHTLASVRKGQRVVVVGAFKLREWESNGRQGVAAEIDAFSLGHDLLWGTSTFTRQERAVGVTSTLEADAGTAENQGGRQRAGAPTTSEGSAEWAVAPLEDATPF
jgi:single stranded DNA-binding protein (ssb)